MNIYHEALLARLACMLVILMLLGPVVWAVLKADFRLSSRPVRRSARQSQPGEFT